MHHVAGGAPIRCHFHNTRNTGYANAIAAIDAGARGLDAAVGGYGGSPFSPNAGGNIATEDTVAMFDASDIGTGLDLEELVATARWLSDKLGSPVKSMLAREGIHP